MGVDISKEKVDIAIIDSNYDVIHEKTVKNNPETLLSFMKSVLRKLKIEKQEILVCCEETGIYKRPLQQVCSKWGLALWVEIALKIKRASTSLRGKSDKQDAVRIAEYALRYLDRMNLYIEPSQAQNRLQSLLNVRESLLNEATRMNQRMKESKRFDKDVFNIQNAYCKEVLEILKNQITKIERDIDVLLSQQPAMKQTVELLSTIPGVGRQTALQFIVYTRNFSLFQTAKQLACYAGIAPFLNESGGQIKKARVSQFANKKLKKLLHLAAMASIRVESDLKSYFIRKVQEGKNKLLVLNNIRNKLVKRMFAVIKRQSEYISNNFETNICTLT